MKLANDLQLGDRVIIYKHNNAVGQEVATVVSVVPDVQTITRNLRRNVPSVRTYTRHVLRMTLRTEAGVDLHRIMPEYRTVRLAT